MAEVQQLADGTMRWINQRDLNADMMIGGPSVPDQGANPRYLADSVIKMTLGVAAGGGGVASWQNPFPYAVDIIGTILDITTAAAGQTVNIGTTAVNGATSANNLLSAQSIAATGVFGSRAAFARLPAGNWITASASGTPSTLAGCLYIEFYPAT